MSTCFTNFFWTEQHICLTGMLRHTKLSIKEKKNLEKPWWTKGILQSINQKKLYAANLLEAKKQLEKKHSSKNSNITKILLKNLQESIRQIFTSHSLRNTKIIPREHGME